MPELFPIAPARAAVAPKPRRKRSPLGGKRTTAAALCALLFGVAALAYDAGRDVGRASAERSSAEVCR